METFAKWFIIFYLTINALATIAMIGRKRDPITHTQAVVATVILTGIIALILVYWGG